MVRRLGHSLRVASEHRLFPLGLALFAVGLMLPSLGSGLFQDDLVHRANLLNERCLPEKYYGSALLPTDSGTLGSAMRDMFAVTRNPDDVQRLKDLGELPWWTVEHLRVSNWRPLAALTHWADYRLFPNTQWLMHLHSSLWFGVVILLITVVYRRFIAVAWVAALAACFYVIDESNYFPVRWLANRNLLMALAFSAGTLLAHDRWRRDGNWRWAVAAPGLLLLALLSTEAAVAVFAYLFAYAMILDRGTKAQRVLSLAPCLMVIVGWRVVYSALGNGASGGGFVVDPVREPVQYVQAVLERAPVLLAAQWSWFSADIFHLFSEYTQRRYLYWTCAFVAVVFAVLVPLLKRDRVSRFWFVGMLLCVLPICATIPMNRNLLFVAIGGFGLTARYVVGVFSGESWIPAWRVYRVPLWIVCVTLMMVHVPVALASRALSPYVLSRGDELFRTLVDIGDRPDLAHQRVILVNAPHPFMFVVMPYLRNYEKRTLPEEVRLLVPGFRELEVARTGDRTLVVRSKGGSLLSIGSVRGDTRPSLCYWFHAFNTLFRSEREVFQIGERVAFPEMSVSVLSVGGDGALREVQFDFDVSLDDPSLHWLWWHHHGKPARYELFTVPAVGQTVTIAGPF